MHRFEPGQRVRLIADLHLEKRGIHLGDIGVIIQLLLKGSPPAYIVALETFFGHILIEDTDLETVPDEAAPCEDTAGTRRPPLQVTHGISGGS